VDNAALAKLGGMVIVAFFAMEGFKFILGMARDAWRKKNGKEPKRRPPSISPDDCRGYRGELAGEMKDGFKRIERAQRSQTGKLDQVVKAWDEKMDRHEDRYHPTGSQPPHPAPWAQE